MVEKIVKKREIACYKQFLFFHNVFHSYISLMLQNAALCGNAFTLYLTIRTFNNLEEEALPKHFVKRRKCW